MIHNDCDSDYETLSKISGTFTMEIKRIKQLDIEIFKTVNNLNPDFMKNIFTSKTNSSTSTRLCQKSQVTMQQHTVIKVLKS